jgi:type 1 glutamine amidotransferase
VQRGTVHIGGTVWTHTDEWYNFRTNPRSHVQVLATVDESSYRGGTMGADHPIAWCHEYQGGRAFYTALGHPAAAYAEPVFLAQLLAAVRYAAGRSPTCAPRPSPGAAAG